MFRDKISNLLNSNKNPFLYEMKKRNELLRLQEKTYSKMNKLIEYSFLFCDEFNIDKDNRLSVKNMSIYAEYDYLYLISEGSAFNLSTIKGFVNPEYRIKKKKDSSYSFYFEYRMNNESEFKKVKSSEKNDMNFNYMIFNHFAYSFEMLFLS